MSPPFGGVVDRYVVMGCLGASLTTCCFSGVLIMGWGFLLTEATADAAQACDGHPVLNAGLALNRPAHVLAFEQTAGTWVWAGDELPTNFLTAESTGEANVVFCFEEEVITDVETCRYVHSNEARVGGIRRQRTRRVRAVEPRTASVLRTATLYGEAPPACPDELYGGGTYEYEGGSPDVTDFEAAMGDLVR